MTYAPKSLFCWALVVVLSGPAYGQGSQVTRIHVQGIDSRSDDGTVYRKDWYNNLWLTFGTVDRERAPVSLDGRFLVVAGQIGFLTYPCEIFTGARFIYDSAGAFAHQIACTRTSKLVKNAKPRHAKGSMKTSFARRGSRWTLDGTARVTGMALGGREETWNVTEAIEIEVNAQACRIVAYRLRRETPRGGSTTTSVPGATCKIE